MLYICLAPNTNGTDILTSMILYMFSLFGKHFPLPSLFPRRKEKEKKNVGPTFVPGNSPLFFPKIPLKKFPTQVKCFFFLRDAQREQRISYATQHDLSCFLGGSYFFQRPDHRTKTHSPFLPARVSLFLLYLGGPPPFCPSPMSELPFMENEMKEIGRRKGGG
jgi:hypothetical protein